MNGSPDDCVHNSVTKNNNASLQNDKLMHTASESYRQCIYLEESYRRYLMHRFTSKEYTDKVSRYKLQTHTPALRMSY